MNLVEFLDSVKTFKKDSFLNHFPHPFLISYGKQIQKSKKHKQDLSPGMEYRNFSTRTIHDGDNSLEKWLKEKHIFLLRSKLGGKIVNLGRTPNNDIVLEFPVISKLHCCFFLYDSTETFICDCGSTNKTWINDQVLVEEEKFLLKTSDKIRFGPAIEFLFYSSEDLWSNLDTISRQCGDGLNQ